MSYRFRIALAVLGVAGLATWKLAGPFVFTGFRGSSSPRAASGPITVAAAGDTLIVSPLTRADLAAASDLARVLGGADAALTNLEVNVLNRSSRGETTASWPFASPRAAASLNSLGVNVVSRANNHAADYGADGIHQTSSNLDAAGIRHAGAGEDLAAARAPAIVGRAPRRIAFIAVTTSVAPGSRATNARGDVMGRPGVSALRYAADVTVDQATFETLGKSAGLLPQGSSPASGSELKLSGTAIKRGDRTAVTFVVDERELEQIVGSIKAASATAEAVVVSVHSHEPSDHSQEPADFLQRFAHAAIDAGAALVVGHGPHQIRGVEVYKGGAILYSLGNFVFQRAGIDDRAADAFDAGTDLYRLALGAIDESPPRTLPTFDEPVWWEGLVAHATFEGTHLTRLTLRPIDLGADLPRETRGAPRIAPPARANAILERLSRLSARFGTHIVVKDRIGLVDVNPTGRE